MEIDIFPIPPKKGLGQSISKILLYGLILLYIIAGYKTARQLISEEDELLRVFATIPFFVGYYTLFILVIHGLKQGLYAYVKYNRKEVNNHLNREDMDDYIVKHLEEIQRKLDKAQAMSVSQRKVSSAQPSSSKQEKKAFSNDLQPNIMPELKQKLATAQHDLAPFIQQLNIDRIQLTEAKDKHDKEKLASILRYTRLVLLPHGFSDEELYQIEEAVKLLVQCNGIVNCVSVNIEKNKLKQADLKNFAWNIGYQYGIDSEMQALFVLNLFHSWFKNTEKETIRKTLRNTNGKYSIGIDEDIIEHLPQLEEKVLGKKSK